MAGGGGEGAGEGGGEEGEVEDGGGAFDGEGGDVVSTRGHLGSGEGAEPDPGLLTGFADLGHPFAPSPHSDPAVHGVLRVPLPLLISCCSRCSSDLLVVVVGGGGGGVVGDVVVAVAQMVMICHRLSYKRRTINIREVVE